MTVHTSVDVREIRSSLIPVATFSGFKKTPTIFRSSEMAVLCLGSHSL